MFVLLFSLYDVFCYSHIHVYIVRRLVKGTLTVILAHRRPSIYYLPWLIPLPMLGVPESGMLKFLLFILHVRLAASQLAPCGE